MAKKKPEKPLTVIRTGTGDAGFTNFRNDKKFPKSNLNIEYLGILDLIQSRATNAFMIQDLIFALGANLYNPESAVYIKQIDKLTRLFTIEITKNTPNLEPLSGFIRTTESNARLMELRATIRQAEVLACQLRQSTYPAYKELDLHIKTLNILSDFVFVCAWMATPESELKQWTGEPIADHSIDDEIHNLMDTKWKQI